MDDSLISARVVSEQDVESSSGALRGSNESVAYRESEWCHQREMLIFVAKETPRSSAMKSSGILAVSSGMFALKSRDDDGLQCCVVVVCI